jgi:ABC-type multidrug transport system fused ATPase/permease subunit
VLDSGSEVSEQRGEVRELSGGQRVLLALSFLFACALLKQRSPLYLMDEVDAALDQANQKAIATAIGIPVRIILKKENTAVQSNYIIVFLFDYILLLYIYCYLHI